MQEVVLLSRFNDCNFFTMGQLLHFRRNLDSIQINSWKNGFIDIIDDSAYVGVRKDT